MMMGILGPLPLSPGAGGLLVLALLMPNCTGGCARVPEHHKNMSHMQHAEAFPQPVHENWPCSFVRLHGRRAR